MHLRDALGTCGDLLNSYGGHAAAAGLEIRRENFDAFKERFIQACAELTPSSPPLHVDGTATFGELDPRSVRRLESLAPFGNSHPRPRFLTDGVQLVGNPTVDPRGRHVRIRCSKDGQMLPGRVLSGLSHFETLRNNRGPYQIVYSPRLSTRGEEGPVQLDIAALSLAAR